MGNYLLSLCARQHKPGLGTDSFNPHTALLDTSFPYFAEENENKQGSHITT